MEISIDTVKELREKTGLSVMQCRKALEEAGGDMDKAEVILRKRSAEAADKKSDREIGAGAVGMYLHDKAIGAMVLLACETDFVSKNPEFETLARELAMQVAAATRSTSRVKKSPRTRKRLPWLFSRRK
jgi:elongation factor Ts